MNDLKLKERLKNPWFWCGLCGVVLTAAEVQADTLTSWAALAGTLCSLSRNPYLLAGVVLAVLGVFIDPTTAGLGDCPKAMPEGCHGV